MLTTQWNFIASYVRARFGDTERGASLVEYALLVALIAVVCIAALQFLGDTASESSTEPRALRLYRVPPLCTQRVRRDGSSMNGSLALSRAVSHEACASRRQPSPREHGNRSDAPPR
mgnify:CR=1 FL=1